MERRRFVIDAPTGSGKSQILLKNDLLNGGEVVILQPRRIAARMLARRVAEEMGVRPGDASGSERPHAARPHFRGERHHQALERPALRGL